ncbi:hypothetical protein NIIDMKKI_37480 [Mycobacterium kansasii]|uniref:Uncharacterized protein n=1 Tax=Mycobacterium kansasii TaxID=1768 RepID=A0A7G1IF54_MYCKA|nr:hypothetical protein NIIDMKKI_37480 [Mycobacterium kansasii]
MNAPTLPERLPAAVAGIDPRGWLVFAAPLPAELQRAEDATADADRRRWPHATDGGWCASLWAGAVDPDDMVRRGGSWGADENSWRAALLGVRPPGHTHRAPPSRNAGLRRAHR